ncbi:xanthine dehydrogenase FAD-binding subunit XdhB [Candidatus Clostridium radicumherbarum]|uniref:Xanthine dehydrogenase FAD-binding subunit XdhB n=1 Tax=Candidatus Clostridium radicumherbarum TaxID=3381662 RepID=A0ABW8TPG1_9CLOT
MYDITNIMEPETMQEALKMLDSNPKLKIIAGGTDVLIRLHHGDMEEAELLSIRNIKSLKDITLLDDGTISIGAMASFSDIFRSEIINKYIPVLAEAGVSMGGPQIRNMATIGGNICNGAVSADSAPALFALNAVLKLDSLNGTRIVSIKDFYAGPGKVKLLPGEILSALLISKDNYNNMGGNYIKFSNRKAMDIAMLGVAVVCNSSGNKFNDLRIALGVAAPTPIRCTEAEVYAKGKKINEETIKEIGNLALKSSNARDSWRGSKDYRQHLIVTLTQRAIKESIKRAGGSINE